MLLNLDNLDLTFNDLLEKLSGDLAELDNNDKMSYIVLKFGDLGPEAVLFENTKILFDREMENIYGTQLGIYLSLIISKGKQGDYNVGFQGPFPWTLTPDHNLLAFSFLGKDDNIKDPRAVQYGVMTIIVIFYPSSDQELIKAKLSIENELQNLFITDPLPNVSLEKLPVLFAQAKARIEKSIAEGDRIIQENAMDSLMSNDRLLYLGLYQSGTRELVASLIGEEESFSEIINETKMFHFDIFFTKFKNIRFGFINLEKFNKIVIMIISDEKADTFFMEKDFLQLYQAIYVAAPLLEEYYG